MTHLRMAFIVHTKGLCPLTDCPGSSWVIFHSVVHADIINIEDCRLNSCQLLFVQTTLVNPIYISDNLPNYCTVANCKQASISKYLYRPSYSISNFQSHHFELTILDEMDLITYATALVPHSTRVSQAMSQISICIMILTNFIWTVGVVMWSRVVVHLLCRWHQLWRSHSSSNYFNLFNSVSGLQPSHVTSTRPSRRMVFWKFLNPGNFNYSALNDGIPTYREWMVCPSWEDLNMNI